MIIKEASTLNAFNTLLRPLQIASNLKLPNNQELLLVLEEVNTNYERGYETKGSGYSREKSRRVPRWPQR
jgi:hypothetical protein